ncbi:MAG TPA: hypothetical protein VLA34_08445, partial [Candidatus Krumholzibacterium sp.]|nr:hypothetical protein [Candidatus Krumholzibacterium sp.]
MIFESFDTESRVIRLDLGGPQDSTLPARLSSLVMVACDCGIDSFEIVNTASMGGPGREAALALIERNPLFDDTGDSSCREECGTEGMWVISRDGGLLCVGDSDSPASYSLYVSPDSESAGKASVFAHIIACVLGFSSFVSFEV